MLEDMFCRKKRADEGRVEWERTQHRTGCRVQGACRATSRESQARELAGLRGVPSPKSTGMNLATPLLVAYHLSSRTALQQTLWQSVFFAQV